MVPAGTPLHDSGGDTSAPSHENSRAMSPPSPNAVDVRTNGDPEADGEGDVVVIWLASEAGAGELVEAAGEADGSPLEPGLGVAPIEQAASPSARARAAESRDGKRIACHCSGCAEPRSPANGRLTASPDRGTRGADRPGVRSGKDTRATLARYPAGARTQLERSGNHSHEAALWVSTRSAERSPRKAQRRSASAKHSSALLR